MVYGKAAFYRIQCLTAAQDQVPINQASLPDPGVYGSRQSMTMEVPLTNTILLFSILGIDEVNNILSIILARQIQNDNIFIFRHPIKVPCLI